MVEQQSRGRTEPESSRPQMEGYGIQAEREGMLPWSHVSERMEAARNYWLATTRPDGRPHATPVWGVWLDGVLYFSAGPHSRKARNLAANPAIAVHLESGDDVVILEGTVEEMDDAAWFPRFADAYEAKYQYRPSAEEPEGGVYAVRPRIAFAWLERNFPQTATRWRFGG